MLPERPPDEAMLEIVVVLLTGLDRCGSKVLDPVEPFWVEDAQSGPDDVASLK